MNGYTMGYDSMRKAFERFRSAVAKMNAKKNYRRNKRARRNSK